MLGEWGQGGNSENSDSADSLPLSVLRKPNPFFQTILANINWLRRSCAVEKNIIISPQRSQRGKTHMLL